MFKRKNKNSYIFIDESGKPEVYSAKGVNLVNAGHATRFLVLSAVRCDDQLILQQQITDFKSELLKNEDLKDIFSSAYSLDNFHANNDYPEIRKRFYNFIANLEVDIDVLIVEKLKCYPWLQVNPGRFYGFMAGQLLKSISYQSESTEIIFSRKDSKLKLRQELEIEVERVRLNFIKNKNYIDDNFKLTYHHNPHYTHSGLQVDDYVSWAVFQVFERENIEYYDIIKDKIRSIKDICNKKYFTRSNPLQLST